jgi:hypothetical protein
MDDAPAAGGRGSKANVGDKGSSCRIGGGRLLVGYVVMMVCGFLMI